MSSEVDSNQCQKLFRLPGTIEEEESLDKYPQQRFSSRAESPLLANRNASGGNSVSILPANSSGITRNPTLLRVSTHSSSIVGIGRQDSSRSAGEFYPPTNVVSLIFKSHIRSILTLLFYVTSGGFRKKYLRREIGGNSIDRCISV